MCCRLYCLCRRCAADYTASVFGVLQTLLPLSSVCCRLYCLCLRCAADSTASVFGLLQTLLPLSSVCCRFYCLCLRYAADSTASVFGLLQTLLHLSSVCCRLYCICLRFAADSTASSCILTVVRACCLFSLRVVPVRQYLPTSTVLIGCIYSHPSRRGLRVNAYFLVTTHRWPRLNTSLRLFQASRTLFSAILYVVDQLLHQTLTRDMYRSLYCCISSPPSLTLLS